MFDWILNMPLYFVNATIAVKTILKKKVWLQFIVMFIKGTLMQIWKSPYIFVFIQK